MTASKMGLLPKTNNWEKPMQAFKITIMLVFLLKAWRWMDLMIECGCG